jgi:hypothetical protein
MTHDELLIQIGKLKENARGDVWLIHNDRCCGNCTCDKVEQEVTSIHKALRAVMELHKPTEPWGDTVCGFCFDLAWEPSGLHMDSKQFIYPCPTIKVIEAALND